MFPKKFLLKFNIFNCLKLFALLRNLFSDWSESPFYSRFNSCRKSDSESELEETDDLSSLSLFYLTQTVVASKSAPWREMRLCERSILLMPRSCGMIKSTRSKVIELWERLMVLKYLIFCRMSEMALTEMEWPRPI